MPIDFQNSFTSRLSSRPPEFLVNIPPHLKCIATLLCERSLLKNRHTSELCEATATQYSAIRKTSEKYSSNDVSIIYSLTKRYLQWPHNKLGEWLYAPAGSNQEERRRNKTPAHTINVQSLMASDGESRKWLRVHQCDRPTYLSRSQH